MGKDHEGRRKDMDGTEEERMMDNAYLADLLFPNVKTQAEEIIAKYPKRMLPQGAMVTRLAPSPTGELHIGTLYAAFLSYHLAKQSGGAFFIRLDDTDQKREVAGAGDRISAGLKQFGIAYEEGFFAGGKEAGEYGPYVQSRRREIYQAFAKRLVAEGKAYPYFCDEVELNKMREAQKRQGIDIGYYGDFAACRCLDASDIQRELGAGKAFTLRLRSPGDKHKRILLQDLFKGSVSMPENMHDIVLLKSDGLPTYHFAHAVDDSLMGTTHVLRGDEWLSSYPVHLQLFETLGFAAPVYGHLAPIMKKEGAKKRKFSKRRDQDGHAAYYRALGIPAVALREYYMRLINSGFEDWRLANPMLPLKAYEIDLGRLSHSGPVFDMEKLRDIARDVISQMDGVQACDALAAWAEEFDPAFYKELSADLPYAKKVLSIGRGGTQPRKDIDMWSQMRGQFSYFWDAFFDADKWKPEKAREAEFLSAYADAYDHGLAKDEWFAHLKRVAGRQHFALDKKAYKMDPDAYAGTLSDAAAILRKALTGREMTPDLYDIMQAMGRERVIKRLREAAHAR